MDYIVHGVAKSRTRLNEFWISLSSSEGQSTHKVFHTVDWAQGLTRKPSFISANLRLELDFAVIQSLSHVFPWSVHTRLLCPPLSPRVSSDSCPLSQWCYLTISSSAAPFSFCLQSFPASGSSPIKFCFKCESVPTYHCDTLYSVFK